MAVCNFPRLVVAIVCASAILALILHTKPEVVPSLEQLQAIAEEYRYVHNRARVWVLICADRHVNSQTQIQTRRKRRRACGSAYIRFSVPYDIR